MSISITLTDNGLQDTLSKKFLKQYPYAASRALNKVAFEARKDLVTHIKSDLHNTTNFLVSSMQVDKATKSNLKAEVGWLDRVKFGERLVEGGTRTPVSSSNIAIPVNAGRGKSGKVTKSQRPANIGKRKDVFFKEINGVKGLWQKLKGGGIKLLYDYEKSTDYDKAPYLDFDQIVMDSAAQHDFEQIMMDELLKAI